MGALMAEDDIYIGPLFDLFNLRFGPEQKDVEFAAGGVSEIKALQDEFGIFQQGRPFVDSAKLLGLGGLNNNRAKNRWYSVLKWLAKVPSDQVGENGEQRIVNALIKNFARNPPLPCFMKAHDSRDPNGYGLKVVVREDTPIFYIDRTYLTISVPMAPQVPPAGKGKDKDKGKKKSKK